MSENLQHIITTLINVKPELKTMTTNQVVRFLNDKAIHRAKLYKDEYKEKLGARRVGAGRNFEFDTLKVIKYKATREAGKP